MGGAHIQHVPCQGTNYPRRPWFYGGVVDVITAPDSATHAATIAIQVEGANDIITAAQVNGAPWSSTGIKAIIPFQQRNIGKNHSSPQPTR